MPGIDDVGAGTSRKPTAGGFGAGVTGAAGRDGAGTGGAAEVSMDFTEVHNAEVAIAVAADDLDAVGAHAPDGDFGEAAPLVRALMATLAEAAARLVTEAKVIPLGMRLAAGEMSETDADQAVKFVNLRHHL